MGTNTNQLISLMEELAPDNIAVKALKEGKDPQEFVKECCMALEAMAEVIMETDPDAKGKSGIGFRGLKATILVSFEPIGAEEDGEQKGPNSSTSHGFTSVPM